MTFPVFSRPRQEAVQSETSDFAKNTGAIEYVAHILLSRNRVLKIGKPVESSDSGATNHPDQKFWRGVRTKYKDFLAEKGIAEAEVLRVEIDCTLMPCEGSNGCTTTVPKLMSDLGYGGVRVRVYSHRDERGAKQRDANELPGRYFDFTVGDRTGPLEDARGQNGGWSWQA